MLQRRTVLPLTWLICWSLLVAACAQPVPIAPAAPADQPTNEGATSHGAGAGGDSAAEPGGIWRRVSIADAENLNPILSSETASAAVNAFFYPGLVGQDPFTGELTTEGALAESWSVSEDGLVWTFQLRQDVKWSDGEAVDSADYKFTYDAIASDSVETVRKYVLDGIQSIETPDPHTVVVTYDEVRCDALVNLGLALLPSHLYQADFSDIMTSPLNEAPTVSAGPFLFKSWMRDDILTVERNANYWQGAPYMEGMIFKVVPDTGAQLAQLQNDEIDVMGLEPAQIVSAQAIPNTTIFRANSDGYDFITLNLANPENPQPGLDEAGKRIEQDPHPILSDLNVRRAIAHSLDYQTIIDQVYLGQGYQLAANVLPAISWAYNDAIQPYEFNLEMASQLLEESGWVDGDGDGVREKGGQRLALSLLTNAGNNLREDLGALVQDQLTQIGFDITFEAIDFGVLIEQLDGQTYDMVLIGWQGLGTDPNDDAFWHTQYDVPFSGFNSGSYHNPRVDELLEAGKAVVGCATADRAPFYKEIQQLIHDDLPNIFIAGGVANTAYTTAWHGIDPGPWSFYYNVHQWSRKP